MSIIGSHSASESRLPRDDARGGADGTFRVRMDAWRQRKSGMWEDPHKETRIPKLYILQVGIIFHCG
ncbi:hypothetical protein CBS147482_3149 [Aspergillus niger]|nr:hypothetical protein CBS147371_3139 [Aspergillus niger]KAI2982976.1 hypothetical protein CBS147344_8235 [Aspergillus niger]KAI3016110.1 hypothetical protein CBS147482_3149 [Aspergillus niger]